MAIKSEFGAGGFNIFDVWSQKAGSGYSKNDTRDTWRSVKVTSSRGASVQIGTLIAEAQAFGYKFNENERTPISQEAIDARKATRDKEAADAQAAADEKRAKAAEWANDIWGKAEDIDGNGHPYLERKRVNAFGLRIGTYRNLKDCLIVPLRLIDGSLVSVQAIFANASPMFDGRDRDYLPGGQKRGAFHMIGAYPSGHAPTIIVCEGYATGASIHMATGYPVAVAMDSGNLKPVATSLRNKFGMAIIIIAADDDQWKRNKTNAGIVEAKQAAFTAQAMVAIPQFEDVSSAPSDFNDLHVAQGIAAVRSQIDSAIPKADNDNSPEYPMDAPLNVFGFPHKNEKGTLANSRENLEYILDKYGILARYNQTRKSVELDLPGMTFTVDNRANCSLAELNSIACRNAMPSGSLEEYVKLIADKNSYSPVCEWIKSKPWDGVKRIKQLQETVQVDGDPWLKNALMYRWLLSAVAAAFQADGFEGHGCLVFSGAQGTGKTTWFRRLVPNELKLVMVGAMLDPADKDSVTNVISNWIVELGELDATFRKADIARLKSFLPKTSDKLRRPYDRIESEYQRRTVFGASVNDPRYLVDDTGNRRWWTIAVLFINYEHDIDMQQLWAEVLDHFELGEQYHLTPEENAALTALNADHEAVDPIEEMISAHFDWQDIVRPMRMSATEVLIEIGFDKPNRAQATHASKVLRTLTKGDAKKSGSHRYFELPAAKRKSRKVFADAQDDLDVMPM